MADGGKRGGRKVSKDSTSDRYGDKDKRIQWKRRQR